MNAIPEISQEDLQLLATARASFCALINAHFLNLPDEQFIENLRSPDIRRALESFQEEENLHPDMVEGARLMHADLIDRMDVEPKELSETMGVDRTRLYRGISPTYGPPPPFEAVWRADQSKMTALLQEIAGIYHKSGLAQAPDAKERLDYIGIELAFIEHLAHEEARAWEAGDEALARELFDRQRDFVLNHLAEWVPDFTGKALEFARTDFYRGHLLMVRGFILEQKEIFSEI